MLRALALVVFTWCLTSVGEANERPRIRQLGIEPGILQPGPLNAITDIEGVRVGHRTLVEGEGIRTGVTAIVPHDGNVFQTKVPAAVFPANAFGKAAGFLQVKELGNLETPIVLTNTLCVGTLVQAVVDWTLRQLKEKTPPEKVPAGHLNESETRVLSNLEILYAYMVRLSHGLEDARLQRPDFFEQGCKSAGRILQMWPSLHHTLKSFHEKAGAKRNRSDAA